MKKNLVLVFLLLLAVAGSVSVLRFIPLISGTRPRLRPRLLVVPASVVRPGNVLTWRGAPGYACAADFLHTRRRLRRWPPPC